jgi:hypothetical protein
MSLHLFKSSLVFFINDLVFRILVCFFLDLYPSDFREIVNVNVLFKFQCLGTPCSCNVVTLKFIWFFVGLFWNLQLAELTCYFCFLFLRVVYVDHHVIWKQGLLYLFIFDLYVSVPFSCLITLARTSNIVLTKRWKQTSLPC